MKFSLDIKRSEQLANICGSLDKNLENIANNLNVTISNKGADFNIKGNNAAEAVSVLQDLLLISEKKTIDFSDIDLSIKSLNSPNGDAPSIPAPFTSTIPDLNFLATLLTLSLS